ncbi:MAG: polyamine aminopropyltransferase [Gammaproteobacteria bacterium]|nr:polyamine aminopropyltransferase [Gammaproteobacteria bacterium]MCP5199472.1 polyamine aminopropyltransferase [Gammaproteobacteria bacterium]
MAGQFVESLYTGQAFQGFFYDNLLFEAETGFQSIRIYDVPVLGRVLVLDGIIQTTEADEFIYHEMLTHVPLMAVPEPRKVMIVGGGDGGTLREVLKHPIEQVDLVEIDEVVISSSREWLPTLNDDGRAFDDPRVNIVVRDAFAYMKEHTGEYDAILVDSTDPVGMAEALFSDEFYRLCEGSLSPHGAMSMQDGVVFFQRDEAARSVAALARRGLHAGAYIAAVPTYYGGNMTFGIAGRDAGVLAPDVEVLKQRGAHLEGKTRHYSPEVHGASFVLPRWIRDAVEGKQQ